eukprot:1552908-Rhodomonas_salina.1
MKSSSHVCVETSALHWLRVAGLDEGDLARATCKHAFSNSNRAVSPFLSSARSAHAGPEDHVAAPRSEIGDAQLLARRNVAHREDLEVV